MHDNPGDELLYGRNGEAPPIMREFDAISTEVNKKLRMRGIGKGFVTIQERFNELLVDCHTLIYRASREHDREARIGYLYRLLGKVEEIEVVLRYMLVNHALTPGEIGVISQHIVEATTQTYKWINAK